MIDLKRILAPTDFSEYSEHALRYACEFADRFGAELQLLSVVHDTKAVFDELDMTTFEAYFSQQEEANRRRLEQLPASPWNERLRVIRKVGVGNPFLEIIRYAKLQNIDLIVMGTHGRTGLQHVLLGSVAEKVVRKAPCPVLTIRHPEHEFVMP